MFLLDENILESQRVKLIRWHFHIKQIGFDAGVKGMDDQDDILPLLHVLSNPTFFTHDFGFCKKKFCHQRYCIVVLRVNRYAAADFIRRFLKHPNFNTIQKRLGWILDVHPMSMTGWYVGKMSESKFSWPKAKRRL